MLVDGGDVVVVQLLNHIGISEMGVFRHGAENIVAIDVVMTDIALSGSPSEVDVVPVADGNQICGCKGVGIAAISNSKKAQMQKLEAKGYQVVSAEVSFIVAWKPKEEQQEYAVCLATLHLARVR